MCHPPHGSRVAPVLWGRGPRGMGSNGAGPTGSPRDGRDGWGELGTAQTPTRGAEREEMVSLWVLQGIIHGGGPYY